MRTDASGNFSADFAVPSWLVMGNENHICATDYSAYDRRPTRIELGDYWWEPNGSDNNLCVDSESARYTITIPKEAPRRRHDPRRNRRL